MKTEPLVFQFMRWAADHGLWELISTIVIVVSAIIGASYLFWTKRRVRHLNFFVLRVRDQSNYPLKVYVEIRNYTGKSVVISFPYFVYRAVRRDPNAHGDSPTGEYEIKFPGQNQQILTEIDYLLRHGENVSTWVPLDPTHTDQEVDEAIR